MIFGGGGFYQHQDFIQNMEIANGLMEEAKKDMEDSMHPLDRQFATLGMEEITPCMFKGLC